MDLNRRLLSQMSPNLSGFHKGGLATTKLKLIYSSNYQGDFLYFDSQYGTGDIYSLFDAFYLRK